MQLKNKQVYHGRSTWTAGMACEIQSSELIVIIADLLRSNHTFWGSEIYITLDDLNGAKFNEILQHVKFQSARTEKYE